MWRYLIYWLSGSLIFPTSFIKRMRSSEQLGLAYVLLSVSVWSTINNKVKVKWGAAVAERGSDALLRPISL